jgi:hypothetical protein
MKRTLAIAILAILPALAWGQDQTLFTSNFVFRVWTTVGTNTWTAPADMPAQVLVVGGGGGGGSRVLSSGGGGAGGLLLATNSLTSGTIYTNIVGAGGSGGGTDAANQGESGQNSLAFGFEAVGGGGGGSHTSSPVEDRDGASGGSGGGGAGREAGQDGQGGDGTASQGNDGGDGFGSANTGLRAGGGGGGAGQAGVTATSGQGGAGGAGLDMNAWLDGVVLGDDGWFAGGGGGGNQESGKGAGGQGGGGAGDEDATASTGGGGGGASSSGNTPGGSGGSGIVILRTAIADEPYLPPDGALVVERFVEFRWPEDVTATNYLVYLGTSTNDMNEIASTTDTSHGPIDLVDDSTFGQEWFWRVDVQTADDTVEGPVASFVDGYVAPVLYVSPDGNNFNGRTLEQAFTNIVNAAAQPGDTILVAPGTYPHTGRLNLGTNRTYRSTHGPEVTEIDGVVTLGAGSVLDGFLFEGQTSTAIESTGSGARSILNCRFVNNRAANQGAIFSATTAETLIADCYFEGNWGANSGAIAGQASGALLVVSNCVFKFNRSTATTLPEQRAADVRYYDKIYRSISIGASGGAGSSFRFGNMIYNSTGIGMNLSTPFGGTNWGGLWVDAANDPHTNSVSTYSRLRPINADASSFIGPWGTNTNLTSPKFRDSEFYDQVAVWDASNTGTNFVLGPRGIEGLRPIASSTLRTNSVAPQGALEFKWDGFRRNAHQVITHGR